MPMNRCRLRSSSSFSDSIQEVIKSGYEGCLDAFRGRGDEIRVYPISFKEYYASVGGDKSEAYEEYALYGGMPLVLSRKTDADKMAYLKSLFTEVYFKDITERYDIVLPDTMSRCFLLPFEYRYVKIYLLSMEGGYKVLNHDEVLEILKNSL